MLKYESDCVDCQLPCLYNTCSHYRKPVYYCDVCGDYADVNFDGEDLCRSHAEERIDNLYKECIDELNFEGDWEDLGYEERSEILGVILKVI